MFVFTSIWYSLRLIIVAHLNYQHQLPGLAFLFHKSLRNRQKSSVHDYVCLKSCKHVLLLSLCQPSNSIQFTFTEMNQLRPNGSKFNILKPKKILLSILWPLQQQIQPPAQGSIDWITYFNMQQLIAYLVCFHIVSWSFWRGDILDL